MTRLSRIRCGGLVTVVPALAVALTVAGCTSRFGGPGSGPSTSASANGLQHLASGQCKAGDPLDGVYMTSRLTVEQACVTVSGIVDCVQNELDGDVHIRLRVDANDARVLTAANAAQQCPNQSGPHLVVEIIPQDGHLPFPNNNATRGHFATPTAPAVGDHVRVTGPLVWDKNTLHDLLVPGQNVANWAEIHPAWNITVSP